MVCSRVACEGGDRFGCSCLPSLGKDRQKRSGICRTASLRDDAGLRQQAAFSSPCSHRLCVPSGTCLPHCATCERDSAARPRWRHRPRPRPHLTPHNHRLPTACSPFSGGTPRSHRRLTNSSHAALPSLSATCQSKISRLPRPAVQNPRATRRTTFLPVR